MTPQFSPEFLNKAFRLRFEDEEEDVPEPASHKTIDSTGV